MHSRIIELSNKPLTKEEYAKEYDIPEWFCGSIADYIDLITKDAECEDSIKWVTSFISASYKEKRMVITKEECLHFLSYRLNEFLKSINDLHGVDTVEKFVDFSTSYKMHCLNGAYDDRYGFWILYMGDFLTLDQFMRYVYDRLKKEQVDELIFYTGSVWDYHM